MPLFPNEIVEYFHLTIIVTLTVVIETAVDPHRAVAPRLTSTGRHTETPPSATRVPRVAQLLPVTDPNSVDHHCSPSVSDLGFSARAAVRTGRGVAVIGGACRQHPGTAASVDDVAD